MKEVLEVKGDEVELNGGNKKNEVRTADWDILTEGQEKVDWGSVAEGGGTLRIGSIGWNVVEALWSIECVETKNIPLRGYK